MIYYHAERGRAALKELCEKIKEALLSALPITVIVYILALTPLFDMSAPELISFTVGAVLLVDSANAGLVLRRLLGNPITRGISRVSFQFYIWHQTIAVWLITYKVIPSTYENPNWEGDHRWQVAYTAACFIISLLAAAALTYGFERPVAAWLEKKWKSLV